MSLLLRFITLALLGIFGLWLGFVVPFGVFLLTGIPLLPLLAASFLAVLGAAAANERWGSAKGLGAGRAFTGAIACGVLMQLLFAFSGGWAIFGL